MVDLGLDLIPRGFLLTLCSVDACLRASGQSQGLDFGEGPFGGSKSFPISFRLEDLQRVRVDVPHRPGLQCPLHLGQDLFPICTGCRGDLGPRQVVLACAQPHPGRSQLGLVTAWMLVQIEVELLQALRGSGGAGLGQVVRVPLHPVHRDPSDVIAAADQEQGWRPLFAPGDHGPPGVLQMLAQHLPSREIQLGAP